MCGRFTARLTWEQIHGLYDIKPAKRRDPKQGELDLKPRFNVAPTDVMPVVRLDDKPVGKGTPGQLTRKLQKVLADSLASGGD